MSDAEKSKSIAAARKAYNNKWPDMLESGVMFYNGDRITKEEFEAGESEKKPREFWIERGSFVWRCVEDKSNLEGWTLQGSPIHVIEKSAFDAQAAELQAAKAEIEHLKAENNRLKKFYGED